jgi:hypothetical protein
MPDWTKISLVEGWKIRRDRDGYTLTATVTAATGAVLPNRGDGLPLTGQCAVAATFASYVVNEVEIAPVTPVGPYIAAITAKAWLGSSGGSAGGDSLLKETRYSGGYMDFHVQPDWCGLRKAGDSGKALGHRSPPSGFVPGAWISAVSGDAPGAWAAWKAAVSDGRSIAGSPFTKMLHPRLADTTVRFLTMTVDFYNREGSHGLEKWGGFSGVVPVNSLPNWLKIPGGNNRWRLYDESIEAARDTSGGARLLHVSRVLLGVPPSCKTAAGARAEWDQAVIGQRNWGEL